jgi:hypothetical protein
MSEGEWQQEHTRPAYESEAGAIGYRGYPKDVTQLKWWNHMPAKLIKERLDNEEQWNRYFKFCVVRDPFDKVVSAFHFQRKALPNQSRWYYYRRRILKKYYQLVHKGQPPGLQQQFKEWLRNGGMHIDSDKYFIDGELCIDFFIRYEHLAKDIKIVCDRVGIPFEQHRIPHYKGGVRPKEQAASLYDEESIALVNELFAFEIEQFGYEAPALT